MADAVRVAVAGTSVGRGTTRVGLGEERRESASVRGYSELSSGCGESPEWTSAIVLRCMRCLRQWRRVVVPAEAEEPAGLSRLGGCEASQLFLSSSFVSFETELLIELELLSGSAVSAVGIGN